MSDFGSRLKAAMADAGYTQKALAERIGLSDPYVSMLCSNKNNPSKRTIDSIADVLGVNSEWLLQGTGPKKPDLSREEEIAEIVAQILKDEPGSKRERIIKVIASLTYEEMQVLDKIIDQITES